MNSYNEITNIFDTKEIKRIRAIAKNAFDVLPSDMVDEFETEDNNIEADIKLVKRAFDVLSEEELAEIGVTADEIDELGSKIDLLDEVVALEEAPIDVSEIAELKLKYSQFDDYE